MHDWELPEDDWTPEDINKLWKALRNLKNELDSEEPPSSVWDKIASEGNFDLIRKLRRVELKEEGFRTIVVPKEGFSDNIYTHNAIIDWLHDHDINVLNPLHEIANMEYALYGKHN